MTDYAAAFLLIGNGGNKKHSLGEAAEALDINPDRVRNIFYARTKPQPSEHIRIRDTLRKIAKHQIRLAVALAQADRDFFHDDIDAAIDLARKASRLAE